MAMDANARMPVPVAPAGADDYETLMAALSASARGRAFLAEYARRTVRPTPKRYWPRSGSSSSA